MYLRVAKWVDMWELNSMVFVVAAGGSQYLRGVRDGRFAVGYSWC